jgi:hypothetical protein
MTTTTTNGRARKSLAEQIDRLDQVLDGLAESLNEAVATAVKEAVGVAVKEAVQAVLTEVLTNPAILAKLCGMATPNARPVNEVPKPGLRERVSRVWSWIGVRLISVCEAAGELGRYGWQTCGKLHQRVRQGCMSFWTRVRVVRHFKVQLLNALAVGVAAGMTAYFAGPWLAAGVSAAGGFATTLAVHAGLWLRRTFGASVVTNA